MALPSVWLTLRQAREAVATNRPDEAHRLIEPLLAEGHRKAWRFARDVARAYITRGRRFLDIDNSSAAWVELLAAESLNTGEKCVAELRLTLTRFGLVQARGALEAGRPLDTIDETMRLRERGVRSPDLARTETAAQDWVHAIDLANKGEFLRAIAELEKLRPKLTCPPSGLDLFRVSVEERHEHFRQAVGQLYDAAEEKQWRVAIAAAEDVLTAAPEHREAQQIRTKAWQLVYPETGDYDTASDGAGRTAEQNNAKHDEPHSSQPGAYPTAAVTRTAAPQPSRSHAVRSLLQDAPARRPLSRTPPQLSSQTTTTLPRRFLLWIDGVGGFLICTGTRITFGQASLEGPIDVPLLADVSRLHAELSRDGEGYLIESGKGVLVNDLEVNRCVLNGGDRLTLGATCQFVFHRPVSASSSAQLQLTSGHRLLLPVDGVFLMGNELILGPGQAHITIPDSQSIVSIFRSVDGLSIRVKDGQFQVNDAVYTDRAPLPVPCHVATTTFTFSLEPVGR